MPKRLIPPLAVIAACAVLAPGLPAFADGYIATVRYTLAGGPYSGFVANLAYAHTGFPPGQAAAGGQVVGVWDDNGIASHAALWITGGVPVSLSPWTGFNSIAYSTNGSKQIGYTDGIQNAQATLWSGTAGSAVNLQPSGYTGSIGLGLSATQQVGLASTGGQFHAMLWSGTAQSAVDLHPAGAIFSQTWNTDGAHQVGISRTVVGGNAHATLWSGTSQSAVSVHEFDDSASQHGTYLLENGNLGFPDGVNYPWFVQAHTTVKNKSGQVVPKDHGQTVALVSWPA